MVPKSSNRTSLAFLKHNLQERKLEVGVSKKSNIALATG
jgi:hypothetical protein